MRPIYQRVHYLGVQTVRPMTPEEDTRAEKMRCEGKSLREIAKALGRARSTIQMALVRLAIKAEAAE